MSRDDEDKLKYKHCGCIRHAKDTCWNYMVVHHPKFVSVAEVLENLAMVVLVHIQ